MSNNKKAVILFSGGLDSTTVIAIAKSQGFDCFAISFDYGQKHRSELINAERLAKQLGLEHRIAKLGVSELMRSALTSDDINVPDYVEGDDIPVTYVPGRNIIFLSIALSFAESIGAKDIFSGLNAVDYSHYPDCRPEFLDAFQAMANLGTKEGVTGNPFRFQAPLIHMTKAEIIQQGIKLGVDYSQTVSCYRANDTGEACGSCDSCSFRKKGFEDAGIADPTRYF